jgi:hypothetical protein
MLYNFFPTTLYENTLVTDILKKFKVSDRLKKTTAIENYRIKEEDTPESLAYLLYKDITLSWLILSINEIRDRNNEWPLKYESFVSIVNEKYNSSCIFLYDSDITFSLSSVTRFVVDGDSYEVKSTDRQTNKIVTVQPLPLSVIVGNTIEFYNGSTKLHTGTKQVRRVVYEDLYSLHHFQDEDGKAIDPRATVDGRDYDEEYTYLYEYINSGATVQQYIVNNNDYELTVNDNKRDILLLVPEYKDIFISKISRMFQNNNKDANVLDLEQIDLE